MSFMPYVPGGCHSLRGSVDRLHLHGIVAEGFPGVKKSADETLQYIAKIPDRSRHLVRQSGPGGDTPATNHEKALRVTNAFNQLLDTVQE